MNFKAAINELFRRTRRAPPAILICCSPLFLMACASPGPAQHSVADRDRTEYLAAGASPSVSEALDLQAQAALAQAPVAPTVPRHPDVGTLQQESSDGSERTSSGAELRPGSYSANVAPIPALPPEVMPPAESPVIASPMLDVEPPPVERIDPNEHTQQIDLWARIRRGFAIDDLGGSLVRANERWYSTRPDYVQRMSARAGRYLFHIVEEVERRGLPSELALLPFIESAFNPQAMSSARASGIWQFIPSTGKDFDLTQNMFRDDRRDLLASTRAALDYLEKLYGMFGHWHLALAAYNWGEGNVARAIARNRKANKSTNYSTLRMPFETRHYVPKLQAVKNIVARPEAFGLALPSLANDPYFVSVAIESDIDVEVAAGLAGLGVEDFRALNPQLNKPVILAAGTPQLLLPHDNAKRFLRELPRHPGQLTNWTAWVAPKTMRPADAARQVGMSEARLREINAIRGRMLIRTGSTLLVPRQDSRVADVSEHLADHGKMVLVPERAKLRRISLKAGRRDSVASIASRYGIDPAHLARWNRVGKAKVFRPGQNVIVFITANAANRIPAASRSPVPQGQPVSSRSASARVAQTLTARN